MLKAVVDSDESLANADEATLKAMRENMRKDYPTQKFWVEMDAKFSAQRTNDGKIHIELLDGF